MCFPRNRIRMFFKICPNEELLEACSLGSVERVQALLEAKEKSVIEIFDEVDKTPLNVTVLNYLDDDRTSGHKKIFELLLKKGANPYLRAVGGLTIAATVFLKKQPLIEILIDNMPDLTRILDSCGRTALHLAVESCSECIVKKILERNPDVVHLTTHDGSTGLHTAVLNDRLDLIDILIKHGAYINQLTLNGFSVLHYVKSGKMVRKLVAKGARMNVRCFYSGNTPLKYAVWKQENPEIVSTLLDCGAKYEIFDHTGRTPFNLIERYMRLGKNLAVNGEMAEAFVKHVRLNIPDGVEDKMAEHIKEFGRDFDRIKTEKMGNSSVTFWRMIKANSQEAAKYCRNEEILIAIADYKFDRFRNLLEKAFFRGYDRMVAEDLACNTMYDMLENPVPISILDNIMSYLTIKDLDILDDAYFNLICNPIIE